MKKLLLFSLILLCSGAVFAQASKTNSKTATKQAAANAAEIKTIDTYVKKVDAYVKSHKNPNMVFADTAGQSDKRSKWKMFASEKALEKFREKTETYEIIYCWKQVGRITQTSSTLFSGSGDWAQYVYHYFREDGTLAKVESDFRTFNGDVIVEESQYYNKAGKQLKKTTQYRDLKTRKFKKVNKGDFMGMGDFTVYKSVKKLPFAHLLPKK